jgi:DNA helicase INO80
MGPPDSKPSVDRKSSDDSDMKEDDEEIAMKTEQDENEGEMNLDSQGRPQIPEFEDGVPTSVERLDNVGDTSFSKIVAAPKSFRGNLKEYQLKGLRWLDNLYEQGINGILADEMGLGKTIQAISLLGHLSSNKSIWGPFLIVAPATTLYNWQQEVQKFCPSLKVLPYWGNLNDRKTLRKFFNPKLLYTPNSPFHILITSYQLIVADEKFFHRIKWYYMILDEAQAIKNINSQRWKILLSFNCRNRLLLTGTPIQNSMAELWALLHFIMPKLFDSHEQFQEWFSKDIEASSKYNPTAGEALSQHQLHRLHAILKPFMLRRVKKDVENEIGPKVEYEIFTDMTHRQRLLYKRIKNKLSLKDLFALAHPDQSKGKLENLMNLVMQFRKVCNHPELFERRIAKSPMIFRKNPNISMPIAQVLSTLPLVRPYNRSPINFILPKLVYDELYSKIFF